jgi:uncharacterized low-complexity protein
MASKKKAIGVAVGSAFAAGMAMTTLANAADNPFALQSLQSGYMVADHHGGSKAPEAKCGQGKCGGMKKGATPATPADPKAAEAKAGEAKCGQGKCGAMPKK